MLGGENDKVAANFAKLRRFRFKTPMCTEKGDDIQENDRDGDDGPAPAFIAFVAQRYEHGEPPDSEVALGSGDVIARILGEERNRGLAQSTGGAK